MNNRLHLKHYVLEYGYITFGAVLVGLAYNLFLLPSRLAAGGISGVSTILYELYQYNPAYVQLIVNIPIFILGLFLLGKSFGLRTLLGTFLVPFVIFLTQNVSYVVTNPFLGAVYGGIILGVGLGLVYKGNGSTGGTAALAQIVKKLTGLSSGYSQLIVDGLVVITSIFVFNLELSLFALMSIYISGKTIDFVQLRTSAKKLILIITEEAEKIERLIKEDVDRGLTKIQTVGGYSNQQKSMILSVVDQSEAVYIKKVLEKEEPNSFVIFINTSDILGRGFSVDKYYGQKL